MTFFVLSNPRAGRGETVTDFVPVDGALMGDVPRCPVCDKYVGLRPLIPPAKVDLEGWGASWGDIAFGPADREAGAVCPECGLAGVNRRLRRTVLGPDTWSGEDVFFARGLPSTILVSERFKSLCETAGLTNCSLVDAKKFGFDHYSQERAGSDRVNRPRIVLEAMQDSHRLSVVTQCVPPAARGLRGCRGSSSSGTRRPMRGVSGKAAARARMSRTMVLASAGESVAM